MARSQIVLFRIDPGLLLLWQQGRDNFLKFRQFLLECLHAEFLFFQFLVQALDSRQRDAIGIHGGNAGAGFAAMERCAEILRRTAAKCCLTAGRSWEYLCQQPIKVYEDSHDSPNRHCPNDHDHRCGRSRGLSRRAPESRR